MNVDCFHSPKKLSLQTKFNRVAAILQEQVNLELWVTGKQRGITTRWSGRYKVFALRSSPLAAAQPER